MGKAIFFDVGHTILDASRVQDSLTREIVKWGEKRGLRLDREVVRGLLERDEAPEQCEASYRLSAARILRAHGANPEPRLVEDLHRLVLGVQLEELTPYPDSLEALEEASRTGAVLGIISNVRDHTVTIMALERHSLLDYFQVIVTSSMVGVKKPHPRIFREALRLAGVEPQNSVHLGNKLDEDVSGAKRVGMKAVWVNREGDLSVTATEADYVARSLIDAVRLAKKLL